MGKQWGDPKAPGVYLGLSKCVCVGGGTNKKPGAGADFFLQKKGGHKKVGRGHPKIQIGGGDNFQKSSKVGRGH